MELFKKDYFIQLQNKQCIIVPKDFLKILIIDNKNNINVETIKDYLILDEIRETERFYLNKYTFIKYKITKKGEYFLSTCKQVSNSQITQFCSKLGICTYKKEYIEECYSKK